ncbi:hypothetical protein N0V94_002707 [Neodidymelliopsis sp. IMI 364377]|nr:hypothetical protein N0V94_002707 [Neodidymelliopsis sp. IMI 364377]
MDSKQSKRNSRTEITDLDKPITIRIHYEGTATDFILPSTLIASRSEFFKNALKQCWRQDDTHAIDVYDYDPDLFALYLHILYDIRPCRVRAGHSHKGGDYGTPMEQFIRR